MTEIGIDWMVHVLSHEHKSLLILSGFGDEPDQPNT